MRTLVHASLFRTGAIHFDNHDNKLTFLHKHCNRTAKKAGVRFLTAQNSWAKCTFLHNGAQPPTPDPTQNHTKQSAYRKLASNRSYRDTSRFATRALLPF